MNDLLIIAALGICLLLCLTALAVCRRKRSRRKKKTCAWDEISVTKESETIYQKMMPEEMLKMLKVKHYSDLAVGDQQCFSSVIMDVNKAKSSGPIHGREVKKVFTGINRMLNQVIPAVYEYDGVAESFEGGGLSALFMDQYEKAVTAAISICEGLNVMEDTDGEYESAAVGLCYGSVMIGVVGHEQRMTILILSEAKGLAGFLRSIGYDYYAKIVMTSDFLDHIEDSGTKFNYRRLGYIRIRSSGAIGKIYDVFDGDVVETRNRKRKTKMVFEKGVELFTEQKLMEARQHFIEVLKMDPEDRAAKKYLFRCDECLNSEGRWEVFIESY